MALFKMGDFLKMAVKDEETGIAFYTALAESTKNAALKVGLMKIADQEKMHAQRFSQMLTEVGGKTPREEYAGQFEKFINSLLETKAFPEPEKAAAKARSIKNDAEGLDIATRMEKDTILFYEQMLSAIPDTHQKYVEEIIREEQMHLDQLVDLKKRAL